MSGFGASNTGKTAQADGSTAQQVQDVSVKTWEDSTRGLLLVADEWSVLKCNADTLVKAGSGSVKGFYVIGNQTGVFALYDGVSSAGVRITADYQGLLANDMVDLFGRNFSTGLWFELVSGTSCTVDIMYR